MHYAFHSAAEQGVVHVLEKQNNILITFIMFQGSENHSGLNLRAKFYFQILLSVAIQEEGFNHCKSVKDEHQITDIQQSSNQTFIYETGCFVNLIFYSKFPTALILLSSIYLSST